MYLYHSINIIAFKGRVVIDWLVIAQYIKTETCRLTERLIESVDELEKTSVRWCDEHVKPVMVTEHSSEQMLFTEVVSNATIPQHLEGLVSFALVLVTMVSTCKKQTIKTHVGK